MRIENEYYQLIKEKMGELFKAKFDNIYLEITASGKFSNKLKGKIGAGRDIIFSFLKSASPDITGFVEEDYSSKFIIVEFKKQVIKLDDIYQIRKYMDLFDSSYAFLISLQAISEEIKRLSRVVFQLLSTPSIYQTFTLVHFDAENKKFVEWFPKNPFAASEQNE